MTRLVLKAIKGPLADKVFPIKDGLIFGRSEGDIVLKDKLTSNPHAEIRIYSSGKVMLQDKNSKNGIYIKGQKKVQTVLEKGSRFELGESEFEVCYIESSEEIVTHLLERSLSRTKSHPVTLKPFAQIVSLVFLRGLQQGHSEMISYGPRIFGSESPDGPLLDSEAPKQAFTLIPKGEGILFETYYPEIVFFNGKKTNKASIKEGDIISVGSTEIKIHLKSNT